MPDYISVGVCIVPTDIHPVQWKTLVLWSQGYFDTAKSEFIRWIVMVDSSWERVAVCLVGG